MRQMEQMMDSMMADPFGMMDGFFGMNHRLQNPMIEDGRGRRQQNRELANPFNAGFGFGGMFGNVMQQMVCYNFHFWFLCVNLSGYVAKRSNVSSR